MPTTAFLVQWFVTWVILAVVFYGAAESIQRYLYETPVDHLAWRVVAVTPLLAAVLVKWPLPFDALFFNLTITFAQAILWFLACWLALRFQWQHAAAAGLIAVATIAPLASSSVQSLIAKRFAPPASGPTSSTITQPRTLVAILDKAYLNPLRRGLATRARKIGILKV